MQRVRRDSASSTDSWSIIEQRCSPEVRDLSSEGETDVETDNELEIGEEAYDSHDSDIEVENQMVEDESEDEDNYEDEEDEEELEEQEEQEEVEEDSEDEEELPVDSSDDEEEEEQQDWGMVSQQEAMSGDGKHFVAPEKIRARLDSVGQNNNCNTSLFLKASLACFLVQNALLLGLVLVSKPVSDNVLPSSSYKINPSMWMYLNDSSLQCCGLDDASKMVRAKKVVSPTVQMTPAPSWENISMAMPDFTFTPLWQPTVVITPRPSAYGTTISKMRRSEKTCKRADKPRRVPKSIFPCQEAPKKYNFSALNSIMQKKEEAIKKVWTGKSIQKKFPQFESLSFGKKKSSQKTITMSPKRSLPIVTPRQRKFNYKLEISPKRTLEITIKRPSTKAIAALPKTPYFPKRKSKDVYQFNFWRGNSSVKKNMKMKFMKKTVLNKAMSVYDSRKKMAKYSLKNHSMRNVSVTSVNHQCKRRDFKKRLQLEDKSHRRRQRLLEYKIEKPCRAIYKPQYPKEKKWQKTSNKKTEFSRRPKSMKKM